MYNGYSFWFCEEESIDVLIARNLIVVRTLLARGESRCTKVTFNFLDLKKKKAFKIKTS